MKKRKELLTFNKQERRGIFFLLLAILLLQTFFYLLHGGYLGTGKESFQPDPDQLLLPDAGTHKTKKGAFIHPNPFNPNYISDFKGYTLGMSALELDRLHAFRKGNNYLNSAGQFQEITGVSDSLLRTMAPLFQFPEWTQHNGVSAKDTTQNARPKPKQDLLSATVSHNAEDLNTVTAEDLRRIRGIGTVLSGRIIRFRNKLGGFLDDRQLYEVYGLDPEVAARALDQFRVLDPPEVEKINLNTASSEAIAELIYIPFPLAEAIVRYREQVGHIDSFDEISRLEGFPSDKIDRIKLYLKL